MEPKNRTGGFASMSENKQREIARKGGMAAHRKGTAHEFTAEEARDAGRKGGQQVSVNRSHMSEIGKLGGRRSAERRKIAGNAVTVTIPNHPMSPQGQESDSTHEDARHEEAQHEVGSV